MLRVFVDSGSSIKQEEKEKYNVEIIPLRFSLGEEEYLDGIDLSIDEFYDKLTNKKLFPKTSLPNLAELEERVNNFIAKGDEVIIITISSGISGTFNAIKNLFVENDKVYVVDSLSAVGGIKILVEEINRNRNQSTEIILEKLNKLIPRIKIMAIPETLDYLFKGGRLSKKEWLIGSILKIKPIISIINGNVKVLSKKIGIKNSMKYVCDGLSLNECDISYPIIPSYTYNRENVDLLISMTDEKYKKYMNDYDNLDPVIAAHWGPNAFGYIFVGK